MEAGETPAGGRMSGTAAVDADSAVPPDGLCGSLL